MSADVANLAERPTEALVGAGIASVMVYVDLDPSCEARINIAADLAARSGAALIGVAGCLPGRGPGGWFAAELERPEDRLDRISTELEKLAERFRDVSASDSSSSRVEREASFSARGHRSRGASGRSCGHRLTYGRRRCLSCV